MASTASAGTMLFGIAWLATNRLTPTELGFFFTFMSLGTLVQLTDFGLSYASLQAGARLAGTECLHEVHGIAARVHQWNVVVSLVASTAVAAIGWGLFTSKHAVSPATYWQGPWLAYLAAVFLNQLTMPHLSLREGTGRIAEVWGIRLVQEWIAGPTCIAALHLGLGLWSLSVFTAARGLTAALWLHFEPRKSGIKDTGAFPWTRWMREIWPFQWKIGVSTLAGFLIFRAMTPIVLLEKGPIAAGGIGLALALMNVLHTTTTAWPLSQAAKFSILIAAGRRKQVRHDFWQLLWPSTVLSASAVVFVMIVIRATQKAGFSIALRLPSVTATRYILAAAVIHHFVACFAILLRSEGQEPLLLAAVMESLVTVSAVWLASHLGSLQATGLAYLASAFIPVPFALVLFRRRWYS